jgi:hypothetical protein
MKYKDGGSGPVDAHTVDDIVSRVQGASEEELASVFRDSNPFEDTENRADSNEEDRSGKEVNGSDGARDDDSQPEYELGGESQVNMGIFEQGRVAHSSPPHTDGRETAASDTIGSLPPALEKTRDAPKVKIKKSKSKRGILDLARGERRANKLDS